MLSYMRPAGSGADQEFIKRYIEPTGAYCVKGNNWYVAIPGDDETLFSCHTDTVHRTSGRHLVAYDANIELAYVEGKEPLGADNTAGVWLLLEMIAARVPGHYLFHYGEEKGCLGSRELAVEEEAWLKTFKRAIAFDRRGTTSVITHQHGNRCCSALFGTTLAAALELDYQLDDTGLYTDTASYMKLIPECTNVSVGYDHEHGPMETLDLAHCKRLRDQVLKVNWTALPAARDPTAIELFDSFSDYELLEEAAAAGYDRADLQDLLWRDKEYVLDILQATFRLYKE